MRCTHSTSHLTQRQQRITWMWIRSVATMTHVSRLSITVKCINPVPSCTCSIIKAHYDFALHQFFAFLKSSSSCIDGSVNFIVWQIFAGIFISKPDVAKSILNYSFEWFALISWLQCTLRICGPFAPRQFHLHHGSGCFSFIPITIICIKSFTTLRWMHQFLHVISNACTGVASVVQLQHLFFILFIIATTFYNQVALKHSRNPHDGMVVAMHKIAVLFDLFQCILTSLWRHLHLPIACTG